MTRRGDKGPEVRDLQGALVAAGYGLVIDGSFGPRTERVLKGWQQRHALAPDGIAGPVTLAALMRPRPQQITSVGAWCGRSSLGHPERDVDVALGLQLTDLHIMVNDHSKRRAYRPFDSANTSQIKTLARRATDAGLRVHLTSWIMSYQEYILDAVDQLAALSGAIGATSIQWDAEEPWMHGGDLTHDAAAQLLRSLVPAASMGVTGIGYASQRKMGGLADACDYLVPQCHSTATSGVLPERAGLLAGRWRSLFGGPITAGLAAYRQHGIEHHTATSAMRAALVSVQAAGVSDVIYWSLGHLRRSRECARFVAGIGVRGGD